MKYSNKMNYKKHNNNKIIKQCKTNCCYGIPTDNLFCTECRFKKICTIY